MYPIVKKILLPLVFIAFILASCSSSKNYYLEPSFQNGKEESAVLVLPVFQSWFSSFPEHTFGSLRGTNQEMFISSLEQLFSEHSAAPVESFRSTPPSDSTDFMISEFAIKGNTLDLIVPKTSFQVNPENSSSRFVVLLDQFYFREQKKKAMNSTYAGQESSQQKELYFETKYAYWDTETKTIIGWGLASKSELINKAATKSDYSSLLSKVVKEIVSQGPLKTNP